MINCCINNICSCSRIANSYNLGRIKEFSLAETKLPDDRVITGLRFDTAFENITPGDNTGRIGLTTISTRFSFSSGELFSNEPEHY